MQTCAFILLLNIIYIVCIIYTCIYKYILLSNWSIYFILHNLMQKFRGDSEVNSVKT